MSVNSINDTVCNVNFLRVCNGRIMISGLFMTGIQIPTWCTYLVDLKPHYGGYVDSFFWCRIQ